MGTSLKDQLLKAGLVSEQDLKRVEHEERVKTKQVGRDKRQAERDARREEARRQSEARSQEDRRRAQADQASQAERERARQQAQRQQSAVAAAYRDGAVANWEGQRRYHFAANGRIEWLMVGEETARKLEAGQLAIVRGERNRARFTLLTAGAARRLARAAPERVVTFHGQ